MPGRNTLAGNSETMGHRLYPANKPLKPSYLPFFIQIRLRQHPKTSFLKQAFPSDSLKNREGRRFFLSFLFLINNLKTISQKAALGQNFGSLQNNLENSGA